MWILSVMESLRIKDRENITIHLSVKDRLLQVKKKVPADYTE